MTTTNNAMAPDDNWYADWIVQYWCSFIVYAPVIGMFLSRLAKGRTIKEFILVNVLAPSLFCCVWIAVFGGMTIQLQSSGDLDIWANISELGMQATVYQILGSLPLGSILTIVFVISIFTSFATLADPMTSVLSTISIKGLRIDSVRGMFTLVGLPISIVLIMLTISSFRQARILYDKENYMISDTEENEITEE